MIWDNNQESLVSLYGTEISFSTFEKWSKPNPLFVLKQITTIVFASLLLLIEEVQNVFIHYKECKIIQSFTKKHESYEKLPPEEKKKVRLFYEAKVRKLDGAQKLICRESSIQVAFQLTLILYQEIFKDNLVLYMVITYGFNP